MSKQLLSVCDKPMIDSPHKFGDGKIWRLSLSHVVRPNLDVPAHAFLIGDSPSALILGDNVAPPTVS